MSGETGSSQEPAAAANKSSAKLPQTFTSSFINKGSALKKFAPKAVARRRNPAAQASQGKTPTPDVQSQSQSAPAPTPPTDTQSAQTLHVDGPVAASSQLQAPDTTQVRAGDTPQSAATHEPIPDASAEATPTSASTAAADSQIAVPGGDTVIPSDIPRATAQDPAPATVPPPIPASSPKRTAPAEPESQRSPKRQRVQQAGSEHPQQTETRTPAPATGAVTAAIVQPVQESTATAVIADNNVEGNSNNVAAPDVGTSGTARVRPKPRAPRRMSRANTADASTGTPGETQQAESGETGAAPAKKPRASKKKKQLDVASEAQGEQHGAEASGERPPKRKRRPRQRMLSATRVAPDDDGSQPAIEDPPRRRKESSKRKRLTDGEGPDGDVGTGDDSDESRPRGRPRSVTPSDAEDFEPDHENTAIGEFAWRNFRKGKLSERERKMREINWDEVKEQRRARELELAQGLHNEVEAEEAMGVAEPLQYEIGADGEVRVKDPTFDPDKQADLQAQDLARVEEDDLTQRINMQSWVLANKRDPQDRIMTGRSKRWTTDLTDQFYDALTMFGVDFQMISSLFPGTSRRSIKTKFNREEKDNPERVKLALSGKRIDDWDKYLEMTNKQAEDFAHVDQLKRELEEEAKEYEAKIEEAKAEYEEEQRQKKLAGVEDSEDENEENEGGKKKKKKKKRERKKTQELEVREGEEVEIIEEYDEPQQAIEYDVGGYGGFDDGGYDNGYY